MDRFSCLFSIFMRFITVAETVIFVLLFYILIYTFSFLDID